MNRSQRQPDRVHVYQSHDQVKLLDVFTDQPYTRAGMNYYLYKGIMYPGWAYPTNAAVAYILLDQPLK